MSAKDKSKNRSFDQSKLNWFEDATDIASFNEVDLVVELIGGSDGVPLELCKNSLINGIGNVHFLKANLDTFFKSGQLPRRVPKPNVIVVDPPRAGMHPDMSGYLHKLKAEKVIYVSCNPTTQARDVKILNDNDLEYIKMRFNQFDIKLSDFISA